MNRDLESRCANPWGPAASARPGGYTILEVLVAVIILALVLPGLASMVISSRASQVSSLRFEAAAAFAQRVYDSLQLVPPTALAATEGTSAATIGGQTYTADWTRVPMASGGVAVGGSSLSIVVSWSVGGTPHRSVLTGALR